MTRRGFSFTELLFAVMIMGIGFIMIAAVFPVGLAQSKSNLDETHAAALARSTYATLASQARPGDYDGLTITPMFGSARLDDVSRANAISPANPRYAIVPLYRPALDGGTPQVYLFAVARPDPFTPADFEDIGGGLRLVAPRAVRVRINGQQARFVADAGSPEEQNMGALAPGGFLLITSLPALGPDDRPRFEGRVYRLGSLQDGGRAIYDLMPGYQFEPDAADPDGTGPQQRVTSIGYSNSDWQTAPLESSGPNADATAYIIGRNRTSATLFDGAALDVAFYTSFVVPR